MKKKIVLLLLTTTLIFSFISCNDTLSDSEISNTDIDSEQENIITSEPENITSEPTPEAEESINPYEPIDKFIELYNSSADNQIKVISELDIHGKDSRLEYRTKAFDNAVGYEVSIKDISLDIVTYGNFKNDNIRIYTYAPTLESAIEIFTSAIHILDSTITDEELQREYDFLDSYDARIVSSDINAYINRDFGGGGVQRYEIMINCDSFSYME